MTGNVSGAPHAGARSRFAARLPLGCGVGALVGGLAALIEITLLGRSWEACVIGLLAVAVESTPGGYRGTCSVRIWV
jgi:hypothetical protein